MEFFISEFIMLKKILNYLENNMTKNHQQAIDKLVQLHKDNPDNIALIICGSLARKEARDDSDIDLYLVVKDEKFKNVKKEKAYFCGSWNPEEFYGIEVDGKIINMHFLKEAVIHASDPTRYSFTDAYTLFSYDLKVNELIKKISVYPEWVHQKRIKAFYAYLKHYRYVGEEAFAQKNNYWAIECIRQLVFFAARLTLAHNYALFPSHKALFKAVDKCKDKPANFIEESQFLLNNITLENMLKYYAKLIDFFKAYDYPDLERVGLILENEWTWFTKKMTISEW